MTPSSWNLPCSRSLRPRLSSSCDAGVSPEMDARTGCPAGNPAIVTAQGHLPAELGGVAGPARNYAPPHAFLPPEPRPWRPIPPRCGLFGPHRYFGLVKSIYPHGLPGRFGSCQPGNKTGMGGRYLLSSPLQLNQRAAQDSESGFGRSGAGAASGRFSPRG